MANQRLNIDIVAKDKSRQALQGVQGSLSKVKSAVFNLQNAFIGLGAGLAVRSLINTGKEVENLKVRLKFLFGTVKEGNKAFQAMTKFAGEVPFSLEEIQRGAGVLAVVSDDAEELAKLMKITGNVAATTGLDFKTTSEQIQRSLSAGISAADLFREKGVKDMLGFKAGAVVSIKETADALDKTFGEGGKFGKASDALAKTLEGTQSMIGDTFLQFKLAILDSGFFDELKTQFQDLDKFLKKNMDTIKEVGKNIGQGLATAIRATVDVLIFFKENMKIIIESVKILIAFKLVAFFYNLATAIGVATIAMKKFNLATKRNLIIGGAALLLSQLNNIVKKLREIGLLESERKFPEVPNVHGGMEITKTIPESTLMDKLILQAEIFRNVFTSTNENELKTMKDNFFNIGEIIAKKMNEGIKSVSKSIAESVILGKDLAETFRKMAQQILVNILAHFIEMTARLVIDIALQKRKTNEMKKHEHSLQRQVALAAILAVLTGGGSMAGGGGSGFMPRASGGSVQKDKPYMVGENGAELFIPNQSGQIQQSARGGGNGGAVNVNFTINAVNAAGIDQLLIERRGTISRIINESVNERGRGAII